MTTANTDARSALDGPSDLEMLAVMLDSYSRDRRRERLPLTAYTLARAASVVRAHDAILSALPQVREGKCRCPKCGIDDSQMCDCSLVGLAAAPKPTTEDAVPEGKRVVVERDEPDRNRRWRPDPKAAVEAERERCARIADNRNAKLTAINAVRPRAEHRQRASEAELIAYIIRTTDGARP